MICGCKSHTAENKDQLPPVTGANQPRKNLIIMASWLIGNWKGTSAEGICIEQWQFRNDTTYIGEGYFIRGRDTLSQESLRLVQMGERLWYVPTVKNQNHGKPVPFKLTMARPHELLFENPTHDFPQKIAYTLHGNDSLEAVISGTVNGKEKSERFSMQRQR